jgi:hypothetical protein
MIIFNLNFVYIQQFLHIIIEIIIDNLLWLLQIALKMILFDISLIKLILMVS